MSIRKIYEIALRIVGVLFVAEGCRYFVALIAVTAYSFTSSTWSPSHNRSHGILAPSLSLPSLGVYYLRAGRLAAHLAPKDEHTSIHVAIQPDDVLHIGLVLVAATLIANGLARAIGAVPLSAIYSSNLIADVVRSLLGIALLLHRKLGTFLKRTRERGADTDNEPHA